MKKQISRERLESLLWMQYENIESLTDTVQLLRVQNDLLRQQNETLRGQLGLLPVVHKYPNRKVNSASEQKRGGKNHKIIETGEEG